MLVIAPAVPERPEGVKTIKLGVLKFARLSRLKSSARNWIVSRSLTAVFLIVEKSHVASPGPLTESLAEVSIEPAVWWGAAETPPD